MQKAAFRCDTFVQYCYFKGSNIYLKELSPKFMFNSFKKYRTALPIDNSISLGQSYIMDNQLECDSSHCFEEKISQLIRDNSKYEDVLFVVDKYKQYLSSNDDLFNSYILKAYKEHVASHRKIAFAFLDLLILNKPSDLIRNELVELYFESRTTSKIVSLKLLSTFGEILTYDNGEIQKFSSDQIQRINKVNEAVIEILKNSNELREVIKAANVAEQIMDNEHAEQLIFDAMNRISSLPDGEKNKILERILFYQIANGSDLVDLNSINSNDFNKRLLVFLKYSDHLKLNKKNKDRLLKYLGTANYRNNLNPNLRSSLPDNIGDRLLWLSVIKKLGGNTIAMDYLNGYDSYTRKMLVKAMRK